MEVVELHFLGWLTLSRSGVIFVIIRVRPQAHDRRSRYLLAVILIGGLVQRFQFCAEDVFLEIPDKLPLFSRGIQETRKQWLVTIGYFGIIIKLRPPLLQAALLINFLTSITTLLTILFILPIRLVYSFVLAVVAAVRVCGLGLFLGG